MYAKGQSQRDISATIQDIYGFDVSHETISKITDKVIPMVQEFRNRPLKKCYPFVFVDAMFVPVKTESGSGQKALYNMIGIDVEGKKDVLGFWLSEDESSRHWLQILEEIRRRGVEDILVVSFKVFKTEFANRYIFKSVEELNLELADYVNWYNNIRIHSTLDYMTPVEYKRDTLKKIV